mgnify:CR=1 FL=1
MADFLKRQKVYQLTRNTNHVINKPILEKTNLKPPQITAFAEAKNFGNNKKAILSVEDALKHV